MKITITEDDVQNYYKDVARQSRVSCCPISQAMKRAGYQNVTTNQWVCIFDREHCDLSQQAQTFVLQFDYYGTTPKLPYELQLCDEVQ